MRLVVTGGTGFVGSHIVRQALAAGDEIAVVTRGALHESRLADVADRVTAITGHFGDVEALRASMARFSPSVVVHAAWFGVGNRFRHDPQQVEANVTGTAALVSVAADAGARAFVGFGSQAEYGPHEGPLDESAETRPTTRYGVGKLAAGHLARIVCEERGLRYGWLRLFSSYGPDDNPEWMLPALVRQLLGGARPALTEGRQRWDFVHVGDVARAARAVAEHPTAHGVFNLGSGSAPPLRETIEMVRDYVDPALPLGFGEVPYRPDQVMWLQANIARLHSATGWQPQVLLQDGLRELVDATRRQVMAGDPS